MPSLKIACLGGGSLYFRRALVDIALESELAGAEVVLYDIDGEKIERMAGLGRRLASKAGHGMKVRSTTELADALDGADFAVSSIGGSGAEITRSVYGSYFHNADVRIPAKYGIHQVIGDTCGPAGMMMGLRSIPVYIEICREMEKRCPDAILMNHSNPMATLMRAIHKYSSISAIGICHGVQGGIRAAADILEVSPEELECTWIGTNHYYWFTAVRRNGEDVLPELMRRTEENEPNPKHVMTAALSKAYGYRIVYPDDGHVFEFYPFATQVKSQDELPYALAESARVHGYDAASPMPSAKPPEPEVREAFMKEYQEILDKIEMPEKRRSKIAAEYLAPTIAAIASGRRELIIANIANQGAIPNLPREAEVEVEAVCDSRGVRPLHMGDAPPVLKAILEKRFAWHELVADAAVSGDRKKVLQALLIDEMAIIPDKAAEMLDELLESSRDLLPQFFPKG